MLNSLNKLVMPLLEPGGVPVLFMIGTTLLALLGNAVYDLVKEYVGTAWGVLVVAVAVLALLVVLLAVLRLLLGRRLDVREVRRRPALVALVSQGKLSTNPALTAIKFHHRGLEDEHSDQVLRHCWLVASPRPDEEPEQRGTGEPYQSSWKNAQDLRALYEPQGVDVQIKTVNPEDPQSVFHAIDQIYRQVTALHLKSEDVIADFTGGTKVMTAAMVLSCTPAGRDVQYLKPRHLLPDGRYDPAEGSEPRWVDLGVGVRSRRTEISA